MPARRLLIAIGGLFVAISLDPHIESLAAGNTPEGQVLLDAAMRLARELSTLQLVAVALTGGFIDGNIFTSETLESDGWHAGAA